MPSIYLIAGEQSGDAIGARLMRAIRERCPDASFAGVGGDAMAAQGLSSLFPIRTLAIMGLLEVLPKIFTLKALLRQTVADIQARRPDVLVTINSPGFTLRVLKALQPTTIKRVALRRAAGLGLAGKAGEALPRPVGRASVPAAVRAGVLRPPRICQHASWVIRCWRAARTAAMPHGSAPAMVSRRTPRC